MDSPVRKEEVPKSKGKIPGGGGRVTNGLEKKTLSKENRACQERKVIADGGLTSIEKMQTQDPYA